MKLSRNTVLITGGTSGIGRALATLLLERENTVIVTGRSQARLAEVRRSLPGVHTYVCDQSDPDAIVRLHAEVIRDFPGLNVLINNAGIGLKRNLNDTSGGLADLEPEIRTNLIGPIQMISQFLPHLKRQKAALIVNVTSGLALVPLAVKPVYSATKAAMHSYTQSLRAQLSRSSVRVVELFPPATDTNFNQGQEDMNVSGLMSADKLAREALKGLEQDREEILPGMSRMIRLISRVNPRALFRKADAVKMSAAA